MFFDLFLPFASVSVIDENWSGENFAVQVKCEQPWPTVKTLANCDTTWNKCDTNKRVNLKRIGKQV